MAILEPSSVSLQTDSACTAPCQRRFGTSAPLSRGYSASGNVTLPQKKEGESTPEAKVFPPEQSYDALDTPYQHRRGLGPDTNRAPKIRIGITALSRSSASNAPRPISQPICSTNRVDSLLQNPHSHATMISGHPWLQAIHPIGAFSCPIAYF